jgi:hypothetical protein
VAEVEPQLADVLLELFRDDGIAAYAAPAAPRSAADLSLQRVRGAVDRVFVDSTARARARVLLHERLPGLRAEFRGEHVQVEQDTDDDAAWQAIIAGYDRAPTDPVPRWPTSEDLPEPPATDETQQPRRDGQWSEEPAQDVRPQDVRPQEAPARRDPSAEGYQPPPPPPLPAVDGITRAAWCGVLGAPALLLLVTIAGVELPGGVVLLVLAAFVGGFVTLVARMKDRPPTDSGPDDGAVV